MAQPFMNPNYFNPYQPQVQPPMDRLAQLQSQQYQINQPIQQPAQSNQSLIYVQGESAAKSWMVGAGQSVLLMDSENPVFYIKSADPSGIPLPLRVFDYTERTLNTTQGVPQSQQSEQINLDDKYVTREEYGALQGKYMEILEKLNNFSAADNSSDTVRRTEKSGGSTKNKGGNSNE